MTKKAVMTSGRIGKYVAKYSNPNSGRGYRIAAEFFLRCIYNLDSAGEGKRIEYDYESLLDKYLADKKRNHSDDIKSFSDCLVRECASKQSARQILTYGVKFLRAQGVLIDSESVGDLKREAKGGAGTVDKPITAKVICDALQGADFRGRAIFLTLASSGLRIGELLSLDMSDIDLESTPARIDVRASKAKNKQPRFTFITPEAANAIKVWLENRTEYLKKSALHNRNLMKKGLKTGEVQIDSTLLFPVSDSQVQATWETCLKRAGLFSKDPHTGRSQYRIHSLRKFFITQISMAAPEKLAHFLAGHSGYLDQSYIRVDPSYAAQEYLKIQHVLTVCVPETVKVEIKTLKEETATLKKQDGVQMESIEYLRSVNQEQQDAIRELKKQIQVMQEKSERIDALQEQLDTVLDYLDMSRNADKDEPSDKSLIGYKGKIVRM